MKSTMKLVENSVKNFCCDGIDNFRRDNKFQFLVDEFDLCVII